MKSLSVMLVCCISALPADVNPFNLETACFCSDCGSLNLVKRMDFVLDNMVNGRYADDKGPHI